MTGLLKIGIIGPILKLNPTIDIKLYLNMRPERRGSLTFLINDWKILYIEVISSRVMHIPS